MGKLLASAGTEVFEMDDFEELLPLFRPREEIASYTTIGTQPVIKDTNGAVLADCTTQSHDGTESVFCDAGAIGDVQIRETASGPVIVFNGEGTAATFEVTSGTAPTSGSGIVTDTVTGPDRTGPDRSPIPQCIHPANRQRRAYG